MLLEEETLTPFFCENYFPSRLLFFLFFYFKPSMKSENENLCKYDQLWSYSNMCFYGELFKIKKSQKEINVTKSTISDKTKNTYFR